jgi:phenylalanyl-tRNA synthetase beta chain
MIITRSWLNNFIDLSGITTDEICVKLNSIGLEVDSVKSFKVPEKIIVGKILECSKHPNADKLQVCKVDLGTTERVIVCGAKNARKGIYVAVATIGATLPNGMEIKPTKLRDVDSDGMLCSSSELGLPEVNNGIMELDSSVGELITGTPLLSYDIFNDDIIEIELTANRGDCLSIYGIARELSTVFNKPLKKITAVEDDTKRGIGIARILNVDFEQNLDSSLMYKVVDFDGKENIPLCVDLLLLYVDKEYDSFYDKLINFVIYTTGVILKVYDLESIGKAKGVSSLKVKKDELGLDCVYSADQKISTIGIEHSKTEITSSKLIIECSYVRPELLSVAVTENGLKTDDLYYNTSRGSEPNLSLAINYLLDFLDTQFSDISVYTGEYENINEEKQISIPTDIDKISKIIGQNIDSNEMLRILKSLGFKTNIKYGGNNLVTIVPSFRHDIKNIHDITEEVVRIIGIDNIKSQPITFIEKPKFNSAYTEYKNKLDIRKKAIATGFYENISFVFAHKEELEKYGFAVIKEHLDIVNPITSELDTLRSTILLNLLNAAKLNFNNGYKKCALFEIGSVFCSSRNETQKMSFLYSGYDMEPSLYNNGKAREIDFFEFANKISSIVGDFELVPMDNINNKLIHPYASANILQNGNIIGFISKLHISVQKEFDLSDTFICELDFDKLDFEVPNASEISKFPEVTKDLSFLVDKNLKFMDIRNCLSNIDEKIKKLYPLDIYKSEDLGDKISLTIRFHIQSFESTLVEDDISSIMSKVIEKLNIDFGLELR